MSSQLRMRSQHTSGCQAPQGRQRGITLVELMISLVVGLILIAAVFNMYMGNVRSARFTDGLQAIQENGRYAVSVLQRSFRLAGYSPISGIAGEIEAFDFENSDESTIVIQTRQPFDCTGQDTTSTDGLAINAYTLNTATNELTCTGNQEDSDSMPIVEGVEQFRVLYGIDVDDDPATCEPQRYVPFDPTLQSSQVVALRFALLVNSGRPIRTRNTSETFVLLDETYNSDNDKLAREVFSSTVMLRNNSACISL
ncbi:MAG: PilW family protein [Granulosicoccus sp.]